MANYDRIGYIHEVTRYQVQFKGHISGKRSYNCHRSEFLFLVFTNYKALSKSREAGCLFPGTKTKKGKELLFFILKIN